MATAFNFSLKMLKMENLICVWLADSYTGLKKHIFSLVYQNLDTAHNPPYMENPLNLTDKSNHFMLQIKWGLALEWF